MASLPLEQKNRRVGADRCWSAAAAMLGLGFAAVPLYRLFCQVTGFGGTTQRATEAEAADAAGAERRRADDLDPLRRQRRRATCRGPSARGR